MAEPGGAAEPGRGEASSGARGRERAAALAGGVRLAEAPAFGVGRDAGTFVSLTLGQRPGGANRALPLMPASKSGNSLAILPSTSMVWLTASTRALIAVTTAG